MKFVLVDFNFPLPLADFRFSLLSDAIPVPEHVSAMLTAQKCQNGIFGIQNVLCTVPVLMKKNKTKKSFLKICQLP